MSYKTRGGKLWPETVRSIHEFRKAGWTYQALAIHFGCTPGTIYNAVKGRTWPDIYAEFHGG